MALTLQNLKGVCLNDRLDRIADALDARLLVLAREKRSRITRS
jgi:hypothetical protein